MTHHHQRDLISKDDTDRLKLRVHAPPAPVAAGSIPSPLTLPPPAATSPSSAAVVSPRDTNPASPVLQLSDPAASSAAAVPTRCASCRKRVGLAGFRCRCGELFCGVHRYSDRHACSFDYKAQAREAIARDNPVYKAPKLLKI